VRAAERYLRCWDDAELRAQNEYDLKTKLNSRAIAQGLFDEAVRARDAGKQKP
jgi:hypothetical protein